MLFLSDDLEGTSVSGIASSIGIVVSIPSCPVLFSLEGRTWSSSSIREQGPTSSPRRLFFFPTTLKEAAFFSDVASFCHRHFLSGVCPLPSFFERKLSSFFLGNCWSVIISIGLCLLGLPCRSGSLARGCMSCSGFYTSWTALLQCSLGDKSPNRISSLRTIGYIKKVVQKPPVFAQLTWWEQKHHLR